MTSQYRMRIIKQIITEKIVEEVLAQEEVWFQAKATKINSESKVEDLIRDEKSWLSFVYSILNYLK